MTGDTQHNSGTGRVLVVAITLLGVSLLAVAVLGMFRPNADGPPGAPTDEDRAIAIGLMLDSPRSPEVMDEALVLAEKLRQRYGIDSGNDFEELRQQVNSRLRVTEIEDRLATQAQLAAFQEEEHVRLLHGTRQLASVGE